MNVQFLYMYRDASNYKKAGSVVFKNEWPRLDLNFMDQFIRGFLSDGNFFIASQVGVPEVFLWKDDYILDVDEEEE